jgi:hypothetical protein
MVNEYVVAGLRNVELRRHHACVSWLDEHEFPELHDAFWNLQHAESPLTVLRAISDLQGFGQVITEAAVKDARTRGITWEEIADALRISRQAVHRRYAASDSPARGFDERG